MRDPKLDALRRQARDVNSEPCLRLLATAALAIVDAAEQADLDLSFVTWAKGSEGFDAAYVFTIADRAFYVSMIRTMNPRNGRVRAILRVVLVRHGAIMRLTKNGALLHEEDPAWDEPTQTWQLDEYDLLDMDVVGATSRQLAQVLITCGIWHANGMAGLMHNCEACPYQLGCIVVPKYLIKHR